MTLSWLKNTLYKYSYGCYGVFALKLSGLLSGVGRKARVFADTPISPAAVKSGQHDIAELSAKKIKRQKIKKAFIGLDKITVKRLESLPINEFIEESKKIILKSLNIPQEIAPVLSVNSLGGKKMIMLYDSSSNDIVANSEYFHLSRANLFSCLRHEIEHFSQNLLIIRTDNLGEHAIETYARMTTKFQIDNVINVCKAIPEDAIKSGNLSKEQLAIIIRVQDAAKNGDEALGKCSEELFNEDFPLIHEKWKDFRAKVIGLQGSVNPDSKDGLKAKEYFDGFLKANNQSSGYSYWSSKHEIDARKAQSIALIEYWLRKYM